MTQRMEDPHDLVIIAGIIDGRGCVSFMDNGKAVLSFNEGDDRFLVAKKIVEFIRAQPQSLQDNWLQIMCKAHESIYAVTSGRPDVFPEFDEF